MGAKLPQPTARLIVRLQRVARVLDRAAASIDATSNPQGYARARAHANVVWQAVGRLEDLALIIEEMAPQFDPRRAIPDDDDDERTP